MNRILLFGLTILTLLVAGPSGCGYKFSGEGTGPKPGLTAVAIPVFENSTSEPGLGSIFAAALREEFIQKGSMNVVPLDETDVVFRGKITNIFTSATGHRTFEETVLTRIFVTLDIRCHDTVSGRILWQAPNFSHYKVFAQDDDSMVSFQNRQEALKLLAREMAVRIHDRFLNSF